MRSTQVAPGEAVDQWLSGLGEAPGIGAVEDHRGAGRGKPFSHGAPEAAVDLAETLAMAAIMAAIGVFGGAPTGLVGRLFDAGNDSDHWLWMALAFALPPIARVALSIIGRATDRRSHDLKAHQRLTLLSLSAATGAIIGLVVHPVAGLAVISLALGIYLFAFIFKPSLGRGTVHEALWGTPGED